MPLTEALDALSNAAASLDREQVLWSGLDVPLEVIEAAGYRPARLSGLFDVPATPQMAALSEGVGHPLMRAVMAQLEASTARCAFTLFGATPVKGVWLYNLLISLGAEAPPCHPLLVDLIHSPQDSALTHNRQAMAALVQGLDQDLAVAPNGRLSVAIKARNRVRALLRQIETHRYAPQPTLDGQSALKLICAAENLPAQTAIPLLENALHALQSAPVIAQTPDIYSGTGGQSPALYPALASVSFNIVGDDQPFGSRAIGPDVDETTEPLAALATRYRLRDPEPAGWSRAERTDYLAAMAVARGVRAVIFDIAPFDHPAAWDQPVQAEALAKVGVAAVIAPQGAQLNTSERAAECARRLIEAAHV